VSIVTFDLWHYFAAKYSRCGVYGVLYLYSACIYGTALKIQVACTLVLIIYTYSTCSRIYNSQIDMLPPLLSQLFEVSINTGITVGR
jgi:hypothetical protein